MMTTSNTTMTKNELGQSGLFVSKICLGTMTFGEQNTALKSLKAQHSILADAHEQIEILEHGVNHDDAFPLMPFQQKLEGIGLYPF